MAEQIGKPRGAPPAAPSAQACSDWRTELRDAVTDPAELCALLDLPPALAEEARGATGEFPLLVPRPMVARMRRGDPSDPLLVQFLPRKAELLAAPGFTDDPLGEARAAQTPGVLSKYPGRILILAGGACAVHCRFCFRRHFPYPPLAATLASRNDVFEAIAADRSIREVILSGGEPLVLGDRPLGDALELLATIDHVTRVRIHTRMPVAIPKRVTGGLIAALRSTRLAPLVVVHVNHPQEIDAAVAEALSRLVDGGVPVLSQSVLLRGVNDRVEVLAELFQRLADLRVFPYYLHQLDRVAGTAHFEVSEAEGRQLIEALRQRLPGYAVPRYVREVPDRPCKTTLA